MVPWVTNRSPAKALSSKLSDEQCGVWRVTASAGDPGSLVPAVTRAVSILDTLADAEGKPLSVSEIARTLSLPKSSTGNLCASPRTSATASLPPAPPPARRSCPSWIPP
ncbi:helix-turn-helix domain-containing protein [Streptomyces sp. 8N114]|uniref:helix-turn-helix domain-containing protein n=1 Tax=Streptomyces sp. 8N114 TaxID=3457419 RepID=UPI003FD63BCD